MSNAALENHCTQTALSSQVGCSRRERKIHVYHFLNLAVKKVISCQYLTSENILCLYQAVFQLNKDLWDLSNSRYSIQDLPKR